MSPELTQRQLRYYRRCLRVCCDAHALPGSRITVQQPANTDSPDPPPETQTPAQGRGL